MTAPRQPTRRANADRPAGRTLRREARRSPEANYLLSGGCPSMVRGFNSPRGVATRPWTLAVCIVISAGLLYTAMKLLELDGVLRPGVWRWGLPVIAAVLGYAITALGLVRTAKFLLRWFFRSLLTSGGGVLHVLPLLLVAVTFFFLGQETWQSIGALAGLPLLLTLLLLAALTVGFLLRRGRAEIEDLETFDSEQQLLDALPASLRPAGPVVLRTPPLRMTERINLLVVGVFGKSMVALVVGLAIFAFFVVFGVLAVDLDTTLAWTGQSPDIWWQTAFAGHTYALTESHIRVAVFLGVFSSLYFVVSSASDDVLARSLTADIDQHLRTCLAVRALYLAETAT